MLARAITCAALLLLFALLVPAVQYGEEPIGLKNTTFKVSAPVLRARTDSADVQPTIEIRIAKSTDQPAAIEVRELEPALLKRLRDLDLTPSHWQRLFAVFTEAARRGTASDLPALSGRYEIVKDRVRFTPRFPLIPGTVYVARFSLAAVRSATLTNRVSPNALDTADWVETDLVVPKEPTAVTTFVRALYPSTNEIPVNLLKLYVHFSQPMSLGEAFERIQLVDESGERVQGAFLEIDEELWDPERMRLTLLLDPGRIKRGLKPHEDLGFPLQVGKSYRVLIDHKWQDGDGNPLREGYEKTFTVVEADRAAPNPTQWEITSPTAGTRDPLIVHFNEPLDQALLLRLLEVRNQQQLVVDGEIDLGIHERQWRFSPKESWRKGRHSLRVNYALEDLAGNNLRSVFDLDLQHARPKNTADFVTLSFMTQSKD